MAERAHVPEVAAEPRSSAPTASVPTRFPATSKGFFSLQQSVGNAAVVSLLAEVQTKLIVGAAGDPYEQEADRVAGQILSRLGTTRAKTTDERDAPTIKRRPAHGVDTGSGVADAAVERSIAASRGRGQPLHDRVTGSMEEAFGREFSAVRVHTDATADQLNRSLDARAFTLGNDIWFKENEYQTSTPQGVELLAHELTHVVQQSGTVARAGTIQRHASWEHRMLSDVPPEKLKVIVEGRDQKRTETEGAKKAKKTKPDERALLSDDADLQLEVEGDKVEDATHVLDAEIALLLTLRAQDAEMMGLDEKKAKAKAAAGIKGGEYLTLVPVSHTDASWSVVTYGELNTLADYYANSAEISQTDPTNFRNIIRGMRERELRGFTQLKAEVAGKKASEVNTAKYADSLQFPGAIGDTGRHTSIPMLTDSDKAELELMGTIGDAKKVEVPGQPATAYASGLARNACHFAPYSWHAWAEYHNRAAGLARQAFAKRQEAADYFNPRATPEEVEREKAKLLGEADELARQAVVENGFGDHFLQDSFASGHLINKTLIMKWFAMYLDKHPWDEDFMGQDEWRQVQATAYAQPDKVFGGELYDTDVSAPSTDPQTAENTQGDWHRRFDALGLAVPASLAAPEGAPAMLFKEWQAVAGADAAKATLSLADLGSLPQSGLVGDELVETLLELLQDGVVYRKSKYGMIKDTNLAKDTSQLGKTQAMETAADAKFHRNDTFALRTEYIPKHQVPTTEATYQEKAKKVVQKDFHKFLNHSYLQLSTNVLHNHFCEKGLTVANNKDGELFKVYGDNAMLEKGAAEGVAYSAKTSQLSLAAIKQWSSAGRVDDDKTVDAIAERFPSYVQIADDAERISIKDWHAEGGPLSKFCDAKIFPGIAKIKNAKSSAVGMGKTVAATVSKDVAPLHGVDEF